MAALQVEGLHNLQRSCRRPAVGANRGSQYNEPEVHHVHEGQSIQHAIDTSAAGDEIVLHAGVYRETIKIRTRNLHIHSVQDEHVEIQAHHKQRASAAVTFTLCDVCRFEGISVRNDHGFAVLISRCSPELDNCKIVGLGGVSITKNNEYPQMHPVIRRCTVQRCRGPGILLKDAKAIIEDNTLVGNTDAAIAYSGLSNPWIKGNVIREGKGAGIAVQDLATGVIRDNTIEENECAGIMVDGMSQPTVWRNVLRDGGAEGVHLETSSKGIFEANEFSSNSSCEVLIGPGCDSIFTRNSFHNGMQSALIIERSSPLILQNSFHSYAGACITVAGNGGCIIKDNVITISDQPGIVVGEHCNGSIEKNEFHVRPCQAPAATITMQKGSYVKVHDNIVKTVNIAAAPYDLLHHVHYSDDSDASVDPSNGLTHSEGHEEHQTTPQRRHSAFAERLQSMSLGVTRRRGSASSEVSHDMPLACPAGSAGAAVHIKHLLDEEKRPTPPLTPTSVSDITFPTATPTPSEEGKKAFTKTDKPPAGKSKTAKARKLSDLTKPIRFNELRRSSMVVRPTGSWDEQVDKTVRRSSSGLRTSSKGKRQKERSIRRGCLVDEMTDAEVRAELEMIRKLLTAEEQRQELQLLRNWLGNARLSGKQPKHTPQR